MAKIIAFNMSETEALRTEAAMAYQEDRLRLVRDLEADLAAAQAEVARIRELIREIS
jgi:hypothetical protein